MTIPIDELFTPATEPQWLARILANNATTQLQATSWQSGGVARTILAIQANLGAQEDALISGMIQGGFLDYAASGTITYTTTDGDTVTQPVTPDPSDPTQNPDGAPGWLDVLAKSLYNVERIGAERASGRLAIANTSANTYGAYAAGSYHVANTSTSATYANEASLTINPGVYVGGAITGASNTTPIQISTTSAHGRTTGDVVYIADVVGNAAANGFWVVTVTSGTQFTLDGSSGTGGWTSGGTVLVAQTATFEADIAGPTGSSGTGQIDQAVTSATGVLVANLAPFLGAPFESNSALAARCRAKLQALSPGGPQGAYEYFALSAYQLLLDGEPPVQLSAPITRVTKQVSTSTGVVDVYVASAAGAVPGVVQAEIANVSNTTPIEITTTLAHGLSTSDPATVTGVLGTTSANGTWTITVTASDKFTLDTSAGNGTYTGGGSVEGGDLGHVDKVIQDNAVPDSVTEQTKSAVAWDVEVIATVQVPQAQAAAYASAVQTALALYFASLPIGGDPDTGSELQYNDLIGVLYTAGSVNGAVSYVKAIPSLTINGSTNNQAFPDVSSVATLSPTPAITVVWV